MSNIAIQIDQLSKQYRLGGIGGKRLVDDVNRWWANLRGQEDPLAKISRKFSNGQSSGDTFMALSNIEVEVRQGEVLGIIGRNGAGKSTLLKILSRVTAPTTGEVRLKGRIASLLEVGTGFHPELTGRENIFLNGAILGMTKEETRRKLDEIVDFSGVERFIDTPVKRYSSGMHVRLGFAVAAHLDPEILIVDEVLSVGDAAFRERCLGKMKEVNRAEGRTVLFVSHDMATVEGLCKRGIVLDSGRVAFDGEISEAIDQYMKPLAAKAVVDQLEDRRRHGTGGARIQSIRFEDDQGSYRSQFRMGEAVNMIVRANFLEAIKNPILAINILTDRGVLATACVSSHNGFRMGVVKGAIEYRTRIDSLPFFPRTYVVEPWIADNAAVHLDWVRDAATFNVVSSPDFVGGASVTANHGISFIQTEWDAKQIPDRPAIVQTASAAVN